MTKKSIKTKAESPKQKKEPKEIEEKEEFDFGGFPKNVKLTKNLGCGG